MALKEKLIADILINRHNHCQVIMLPNASYNRDNGVENPSALCKDFIELLVNRCGVPLVGVLRKMGVEVP